MLKFVLLLKAKQQPCRRVLRKVSYYSTCKKNKGIMLQTNKSIKLRLQRNGQVSGLVFKHVTRNKMNQNNHDMIKTGSNLLHSALFFESLSFSGDQNFYFGDHFTIIIEGHQKASS